MPSIAQMQKATIKAYSWPLRDQLRERLNEGTIILDLTAILMGTVGESYGLACLPLADTAIRNHPVGQVPQVARRYHFFFMASLSAL